MILPSGIEIVLLGIPLLIYLVMQVALFRILPPTKRLLALFGLTVPIGTYLIVSEPLRVGDWGSGLAWCLISAGLAFLWGFLLHIWTNRYLNISNRNPEETANESNPGCVIAMLIAVGLMLLPTFFWTLIELGMFGIII